MAEEYEYGQPLYPTFIGTNPNKELIIEAFKIALNKAIDNHSPLYFTVISGVPGGGGLPGSGGGSGGSGSGGSGGGGTGG